MNKIERLANFLRYSTAFTYESYPMIDDVIFTSKVFSIINSKVAVLNCLRTVAVWSEVLQYWQQHYHHVLSQVEARLSRAQQRRAPPLWLPPVTCHTFNYKQLIRHPTDTAFPINVSTFPSHTDPACVPSAWQRIPPCSFAIFIVWLSMPNSSKI